MSKLRKSAVRYLAVPLAVAGGLLLAGTLSGGRPVPEGDRRSPVVQQPAPVPALAGLREWMAQRQHLADRASRGAPRPDGGRFSLAEEPDRRPRPAPAGSGPAEPVPAGCGDYRGNRATGCRLLLEAGFGISQMSCLDQLWTHESGWNELAENPSSGAYGIPQALPGDKMAASGDDWRTSPQTQIRWGLGYIGDRYGTPCDAWGFWQANTWY